MPTKILGIRLKPEEKKCLEKEARRNGMTVSDYIRNISRLKIDLKVVIGNLRVK